MYRRISLLALTSVLATTGCKKKSPSPAEGSGSSVAAAGSATAPSAPGKGVKASLGGRAGGTPFAPSTQGFKFQNYGNEDGIENLTAVEVHRMFGDDACASLTGGTCLLTPAAEQWMDENNKGMDGGHCEGFAALSLLFTTNKLAVADFGASTVHDLELAGNHKLQHEIAYWFTTQYLAPMSNAEIKTLTPTQVVDKLVEAFSTGTDSYTLGFYMRDMSGGHATTPYAIVEKSPDEVWIMHYDNNFPGEERHIDIDRKTNTWKYFTAADPKEPGSAYDGDGDSKTLTLAPTSVRLSKFVCPFCGEVDDPKDDDARAKGSRQIILDGDADLLIADSTGKRIGYVDGKLVNEIPGALAVAGKVGTRRATAEPIYEVPAGKALTVTLDGSRLAKEEGSDVSLIAQGYTMGVYGIELDPGQRDTIEFSADWKHVAYTTAQADTPDLELGVTTLAADYEFVIRAGGEAGGQRVEVSIDVKTGMLSVEAAAKDGTAGYEVEIHRIDDHGEQVFKHKGVAAGAKDRFVFHYADWKGNGTGMAVGVDHGDDGTVDEDEEIEDEE
ncbi:MAG: hypothetical protein NT062_23305 [Proteobacteria bacterium]|nr:hypothetical protein [Pseudomonadota bacterium]